jgi:hypothetical protein
MHKKWFLLPIAQACGFALIYAALPPQPRPLPDADILLQETPQLSELVIQLELTKRQYQTLLSPDPITVTAASMVGYEARNILNPSPAPDPVSPAAQQAANQHAQDILTDALRAGIWTEQHFIKLLPHSALLSQPDREVFLRTFYSALQQEELQLQGPPPTF